MRIEDYAGMDMFAWKGKARDIIPGWPRGRSTSRPYQMDNILPALFGGGHLYRGGVLCVVDESNGMTVMGVDHRWMQDWADQQAEERRKAEMMDEWSAVERVQTRFSFDPDNFLNRHFRRYLRRWLDTQ